MVLTLTLMASAAVCIPFTASAEYNGTKYTFENFNANIYGGGGGVKGPQWEIANDNGAYLRYKNPGWNDFFENPAVMSVCKGGTPQWNGDDKIGFTLGETYNIEIEYRYLGSVGGESDYIDVDVSATFLNDGNVNNYDSTYNQKLFTLKNTDVSTELKTYTGSITVPESFEGNAAASNFGIVIQPQANCYTSSLTFDIKSVTITPAIQPEQDDMTIDFSNHQTKASADDYGSNCVVQNTPFSNWTSVTEESGNKYLKLEKTGAAQDFKAGQWQYEADDGFNLICNQAGNVGWYGYEAPLKDAFVLKDNTEYFIKLRYRLKFTDGAGGTVPVKMLHTGKLNTASQALCECGIENNGVTLAEADGWKTVAFSATNKCTDSEDWNCFGLGFYDETVINRNFELCVDEVTISSTNPMYGDADGNNEIDIRDLVRIKRYSAGMTDEINSARADLDFDGVVGSGDLALLRRQLIG